MLVDEKKPVSAPRHIASDVAITGNLDRNASSLTIARHVRNGNFAAFMKRCRDDTYRSFDAILAGTNASHESKCNHQANRPVPAHTEITHVIEKDNACFTGRICRFAQQRTD